VEVATDS